MAEIKIVLEKIRRHPEQFTPAFHKWMTIFNLHVFDCFENLAGKTWEAGFRRYSARTILGYMRHETMVRQHGVSQWKVDNNLTADFARLYLLLHPEHAELFETRKRKMA